MFEFLLEHFRSWGGIEGESEAPRFRGPKITGLASTKGKCIIGFDYPSHIEGVEHEYVFSVIRWVAIKVGKRRRTFRGEGLELPKPVPYYVYDGLEPSPILLEDEWGKVPPKLLSSVHTRLGMRITPAVARELAWRFLSDEAYIKAAYPGLTAQQVEDTLIETGLEDAQLVLQTISDEIERLDGHWTG